MTFDWRVVSINADLLLEGLFTTLTITLTAMLLGATLGIVLCVMRISPRPWLSAPVRSYISFFRVTPELALIFWAYFCLPPLFNLRLSGWSSGTLVLGMVAAAYLAEIYRAGIEAVPRGQVEAAKALGLGWWPLWGLILLPQALRRMTPPLLNYATEILKNSTLLAGVGVGDLAYQAYTLGAQTFRYVELLSAIAVIFFVLIFPLSLALRFTEARLNRSRGS